MEAINHYDEHDDHDDHLATGDAPEACDTCVESRSAHASAAFSRRVMLRTGLATAIGASLGGPLVEWLVGARGFSGLSAVYAAPGTTETALPIPQDSPIKAIIVLWMDGAPSQMELFDPKPGHANGGPTPAINTAIKGAQISSNLPRLAEVLDRCSLIRCLSTKEGNHQRARVLMRTGFAPNPTVHYPGLGAIFAHEKGDPTFPLPSNVAINGPGQSAGELGTAFDPFFVNNPGKPVQNLSAQPAINPSRMDRRMALLAAQEDRFRQRLGGESFEVDAHHTTMEQALSLMRAEHVSAFGIAGESAETVAAYGDSNFGKGCLMARRLVEAGVKYVEVNLGGWDTHEDNFTRCANLGGQLDAGFSTLIKDLEARDLLDSTLILCMGEFGRTPKINAREGRDHFPRAWSCAVAGAGIKRGQVIGSTSPDGTEVVGSALSTGDLFRTLLWASGIDPDYEYYAANTRPMKYADGGRLISSLLNA